MRVESANRAEMVNQGLLADTILRNRGNYQDEDTQLVREALRGSEEAFGQLFHRYERRMFLIANRILRHREDAEDAVQQAFKHVFVHLNSFQGDSRFSTWITRIAINEALQLVRKRRPGHTSLEAGTPDGTAKAIEIEDAAPTAEETVNERELHGLLNQAIGELRPIFRKVVQLYEIGELSSEKTARKLGLSNSTVKARAFRARRLLRRKLAVRLGIRAQQTAAILFVSPKRPRAGVRRQATP
jgi:RNA polymerase sigma-70 factor, ECF subfamily